ncbi:MAG TPA: imelysin family protein [Gammaproteobacteria bacterium]|nr:imelysin family protein [Gammaproteobacteria bacterium]
MNSRKTRIRLLICLLAAGAASCGRENEARHAVMETYANIAQAVYQDSLKTAVELQQAVDAFLNGPSAVTHEAVKQAWLRARIPYGQSEVFRFGNPNVDEWEIMVNSWPLDEGLIDYVAGSYEYEQGNPHARENLIAGTAPINADLLRSYHEKDGAEANVTTGYHAIEFLLWGQDFNHQPTDHGLRPYTDYVLGEACSNGNCERRRAYLKLVTELLVADLGRMAADWSDGLDSYRTRFLGQDPKIALRSMFFGMGSLSLGELAGQRMNAALLAGSQEDEHSCFSDNTHVDIETNLRGIRNVYLGVYTRVDGSILKGPGLTELVRTASEQVDQKMRSQLDDSAVRVGAIVQNAQAGIAFDQQILNEQGQATIRSAVAALRALTETIEAAARATGVDKLTAQGADTPLNSSDRPGA